MRLLTRTLEIGPDQSVSSLWGVPPHYPPANATALIIAHGAGNDMHAPFIRYLQEALTERGLLTVCFNFLYKERGRKAPDRAPLLETAWKAVIEAVRDDPELAPRHLFLSGKSMGGRIATQLLAGGESAAGVILFGYPLHPAGKPEKLRAEHLQRIRCPLLFIQGTRDSLCRLEHLKPVLEPLQDLATLHLIEGGDHSFKTLKRLGRSETEVWAEIVETTVRWIENHRA